MSITQRSVFCSLPKTARGVPMVLGGDPKGKNFLYTNGNSVFIRNLDNPTECDIYTQHTAPTVCAKYSPSGFYICSADASGKVRIWDTVNAEHILKNEFHIFGGPIKDVDYSSDNQRLAIVGAGMDSYARAINAETGASVGDLSGPGKQVNSVAFKPSRPFRIALGGDDQSVSFYQGPPFKFASRQDCHGNFVNTVRYSPTGDVFVSGGADKKIFIYDGKTGEMVGELGSPAHGAGVYALCFNKDGTQLLSAGADKTAKIWDMASKECVCTFTLGKAVEDMQVACLWQGDTIISVSVSGHINYLDRENPTTPKAIVKGHNKPINALVVNEGKMYSGSADGQVCCWDINTGANDMISGTHHSANLTSLSLGDGRLVSCGFDDTVRFIDIATNSFRGAGVKLPTQPQGVAAFTSDYVVTTSAIGLFVVQESGVVSTLSVDYVPICAAVSPDQTTVAVGGKKDQSVHIYTMSAGTLVETKVIGVEQEVRDIKFSPDGAHLACCGTAKKVVLLDSNFEVLISAKWLAHLAKVECLAWSPNSQLIATGGLDTHIRVYSLAKQDFILKLDRAHVQSSVTCVSWLSDNILVSAGLDSNIKQWDVTPY